MRQLLIFIIVITSLISGCNNTMKDLSMPVSQEEMQYIYKEVCTPVKHGLVVTHENPTFKSDSPSVFRYKGKWYMTWIVFDGNGYETWLSDSEDLLHWNTLGKVLSYTNDTWDKFQRAGYVALQDLEWGGSYELQKYNGKYWMSYLGGCNPGYETEPLMIGLAYTDQIGKDIEWVVLDKPIMSPSDSNSQWFEKRTQYKSCIIEDKDRITGHRFLIYYNAKGENPDNGVTAERIGMAYSEDLINWTRHDGNPVVAMETCGITGDPQIQKIGDLYVMFFFRAFNPAKTYRAYNTFACSRDLIHWYEWEGEDLIYPTEPYDNVFAHKSHVVRWNGITYHFYCAVDDNYNRGIAVATSSM